jgi:sigma-B regulation protein RsbU (phosphoserine phosphatase)
MYLCPDMEKKKSKLSRRITWRAIGIMLFFNVLIIGVILVFVFLVSLLLSELRGQYVADGISGKMESMLRAVEIAAANNVDEVEANIDSPQKVFDALEHELRLNKNYVGCFAAFEPDYFKGQGRWFEAYAYYTDSTHIELRQLGSPKHDYFNGVWYEKGFNLNDSVNGYLTDPYFDDSVGSSMYCSYVLPIHDRDGRRVGVYGIDLNLDWIGQTVIAEERRVKAMEFYVDPQSTLDEEDEKLFYIQILDSKGDKIAGSDSIDSKIFKDKLKESFSASELEDLKGTPYYVNYKHLGKTGWTLVVLQHKDMVFMWGALIAAIILFFMGIGVIVIFFFMRRSIRRATKPLGFLSESSQEVAKGNFDTVLPTFKRNDEVAQLRDSFNTMQQSLKQYVEELKVSTAAKASIESEMNVAHNIQMSMLPKTFPAFPNRKDIELYASLTPAKGVGGDLYDFFIRDEKLFFCIGDVSGKGVPASLVMAVTRTLFRNIAMHTDKPSHIVETINDRISEGNDNCMFVTLFVGVLDLASGHLRYSNAGHEAPYIDKALLPCDHNLPVGVMPDMKFSEQETVITSGTTIFLYTDGLTEAENAVTELFGKQRLASVITVFTGSSQGETAEMGIPQELIETMTAAVHEFVGETEQSDDLTMLAIKYTR